MTVWLGGTRVFWPALSWLSGQYFFLFLFLLLALSFSDGWCSYPPLQRPWKSDSAGDPLSREKPGHQAWHAMELCPTCQNIWSDCDLSAPWDIWPFHPCLIEVANLWGCWVPSCSYPIWYHWLWQLLQHKGMDEDCTWHHHRHVPTQPVNLHSHHGFPASCKCPGHWS